MTGSGFIYGPNSNDSGFFKNLEKIDIIKWAEHYKRIKRKKNYNDSAFVNI